MVTLKSQQGSQSAMNPNFPDAAPPAKTGLKFRHIAILLFLAFVGGVALMGWLGWQYGILDRDILGGAPAKPAVTVAAQPAIVAPKPLPVAPVASPDIEIDGLQNRLSEISQDEQAASGNANRAETMMIAFAARRAIEAGTPLGAIQGQLEQRFGLQAPNAVSRILAASARPVTLSALQTEFARFADSLLLADADAGLWSNIQREMGSLFVLRRGASASNSPVLRMERARQLVGNGDIAGAIDQIAPLPGAARAQAWLEKARNYVATRQALDAIERSALASVTTTPAAEAAPALAAPVAAPAQPQALPTQPAEPVE
jgi:hypothetical protein